MCNNTKAISFWNFLKENTIEIPIIQRDYAQGRLGKENLRKNFLADLKNALDSNEIMKLDFVYGSIENDNLNPLDGQQRLTTLWLLHWYIALRAGELSEDNCKIFRKFTYETRISSREFCQNLCNPNHFDNFDGNDIVGYITKQTWFYSAWKQDPTIQSMLRMLGGTTKEDKDGNDIVDGIEELFKCSSECFIDGKVSCVFKSYWKKLTSVNAPIVFYHLPLKDFGLSDDLYIKMNARGKQLTNFENFKADLIGYIKQVEDNPESEWKDLLDAKNGIPIKLDTDWTDIFWKNKSKKSNIDEIYFAFINRYFIQELICAKKEDNTDLYSVDYLEKENVAFRHLYGERGDDSRLQYSGLDKYLFSDDKEILHSLFTSFSDTLNNFKPDNSNCKFFGACCLNTYFPTWVDSKFEFIPRYDETGNITTLGQKERVVFLAVCRYFEKGNFNNVLFKRWMRVVWNIVENSGIETISAMIGAMRLIDELSEGAHDIYNFLSNSQLQVKSQFAKDQVVEEIAKAKQIINGGDEWETKIIDAEKYAFFKGAIRFLFTNENGEVNDESWDNFDKKWENAKKYFDENGVKEKYKTNSVLLRTFISRFKKWGEFWGFNYDNEVSTWKYLLTSERYLSICEILSNLVQTENIFNSFSSSLENCEEGYQQLQENVQNDLVKTNIIAVFSSERNAKLNWRHNKYCLYPTNTKSQKNICIISDKRNTILAEWVNNKTIECHQRVDNSSFFWGWDINFIYEKLPFRWHRNDLIYLMDYDNHDIYLKRDETKTEELDKYFCFDTSKVSAPEKFKELISNLISEWKNR